MFQFQIEAFREAPFTDVIDLYLQDLRRRGYSDQSVTAYACIFRRFLRWCDQQGIETVAGITDATMGDYQSHLTDRINSKSARPLRSSTRVTHLYTLGRAFAWMRKQGIIEIDPMAGVVISAIRR